MKYKKTIIAAISLLAITGYWASLTVLPFSKILEGLAAYIFTGIMIGLAAMVVSFAWPEIKKSRAKKQNLDDIKFHDEGWPE